MEETDKSLKRFNLFLPINVNTIPYFNDFLSIIKEAFGGCTFSRFHVPPLSLGNRKTYGYFIGRFEDYPDEDVCYIIVDVDLEKHRDVYDDMTALTDEIRNTGEEVVWLTYHDIMIYT